MKKIVSCIVLLSMLFFCGGLSESDRDDKTGVIIATTAGYAYALSSNGSLYAFGVNQYGQLGLGYKSNRIVHRSVVNTEKNANVLDYSNLQDIVAGSNYSYLLFADDSLYGVGRNDYGQTVPGKAAINIVKHTRISSLDSEDIIALSTGFGHTLALTVKGEVYAWGRNDRGQVGNGTTKNVNVSSPVKLPLSNIKAIEAGGTYSLALDAGGIVWAWGDNEYGEILGAQRSAVTAPVPLDLGGMNVRQLSGGGYTVFMLDTEGRVWAWGRNDVFQCGIDTKGQDIKIPSLVDIPLKVESISTYSAQSLVMTEDGALWSWGSRYFAKSTEGLTPSKRFEHLLPAEVMKAGEAALFACGQGLLVMKQNGELFACGHRRTGQFGDGEGLNQMIFITTGVNLLTNETWE